MVLGPTSCKLNRLPRATLVTSFADAQHCSQGLPDLPKPKAPIDAVKNGLTFFEHLQLEPGHWGCEYGGPMFLLPLYALASYVTKGPIPEIYKKEIKNYLFARAHPEDGGWGLHIEGESTVLGITLNYMALRIVGCDADHPVMAKARATLYKLGGATHAPHWAKFWMAVLGVCKYDMVNPAPPELWLLPDWAPIAPWRWWIHIRMVFLPMSYLISKGWQAEETELVRELRKELFVEPWESIQWAANRNTICPKDNYHAKSWLLNMVNSLLVNVWNPYLRPNFLKNRAEDWVGQLLDMEMENTDYACLAPVSQPMTLVCCYVRDGPDSYTVRRLRERAEDAIWVNREGLMVNGTNGVQSWDTAFAIQAVMSAGLAEDPRWRPMLTKALKFLDDQQIRKEVKDMDKCYRHPRKGAWAFSNKIQGYAVSDCVSEALKSVILLQKTPGYPQLLDDRRIFDAVDTLLTYQDPKTGGCASYERPRAGQWMEMLNAAEIFGNIMVEYLYPECTTAAVTTLSLFHKYWPDYRSKEVETFIARAVSWIKTAQFDHGGWYGSWAICFTYATMFALESLAIIGEIYDTSKHSKRGCDFLVSKQRADGGWSESYQVGITNRPLYKHDSQNWGRLLTLGLQSCEQHKYIEHPAGSQVVMTAWALIGLMNADYPEVEPLRKGVRFIMDRQQPNGEWKQEAIEGVFNKSCCISYPNYKFTFTLKALGMFAKRYPKEVV